jgi:hypothetical protein
MSQPKLIEILLSGKAPLNIRSAVSRGLAPLPPEDACRALVFLAGDEDPSVAANAKKNLSLMDKNELVGQLKSPDCSPSVLEYFAMSSHSETLLRTIIENPATPGPLIEILSLTLSPQLLLTVLENRVRILEHPGIIKNIKRNPLATKDIQRVILEIETEFLGSKKKEYVIAKEQEEEPGPESIPELEFAMPLENMTLDGLPADESERNTVIAETLSGLSFREKIRYALFGDRQVRALLVRDTNREVSRMVIRSPKITEAEVESFSSMRGINEDILRDIGNSKEFTKSYNVVHNLIKNPKTPPIISQRLIFRLRTHDLTLLSRDRGIPEAIRFHANRMISQRSRKGSQ